MATRPTIEINFKQLATTLIKCSERGTAILLLNNATLATDRVNTWNYGAGADCQKSPV